MDKKDQSYVAYTAILKKELVPAMGCTEPIAIAFTAAKAREVLGRMPDRVKIAASGNIIKNVKSVVVPHTGGMKGLEAAAAIGIIAGDASKSLEVISGVSAKQTAMLKGFLEDVPMEVSHIDGRYALDIAIHVYSGKDHACVRVAKTHANIIYMEYNGQVLFQKDETASAGYGPEYDYLNMEDIYDYACTVDLSDISDTIGRQITYNSAISQEGLKHPYGANIAGVLLSTYGDLLEVKAKAAAAAGSDARMGGCELPVIINSGSGNQGMTASLPVIVYAEELRCSKDKLYRALVLSNLVTIYQKIHIGRLSAYCGAVSAGAGAGAGIAYLLGSDLATISQTVVNAVAITSGIICDGAKSSCAAKIAAAVDAGILGYHMCCEGRTFNFGDGIVGRTVEETIENVGDIARVGMKGTDEEIIDLMIHDRRI